jgi:hypothetical protein
MNMNKLVVILVIGLVYLSGCGKPHDPESLNTDMGGYKVLSRVATPGNAQDIVSKGNYAYIAQGEGGFIAFNVSNPYSPQMASMLSDDVRGYSTRILIKDTIVYIAAGSFGVTVINVSNPQTPVVTVSNLGMKPARNLHIMGKYLFTAVSELGVKIAEISDLMWPDVRGGVSTTGYAYGVGTTPDSTRLLVANGELGFSIFDISDMQEGYGEYPMLGWCDTPGYAESVVSADNGKIAFLACGNAGLQIVDFSNLSNIRIVGSFYHSGYAKALILKNQKIYLAARRGGLQVIDVSDVTKPVLVGKINTGGAMGLDVRDEFICIADEVEGMILVAHP